MSCRKDGGERQINFTSLGKGGCAQRKITWIRERPSFMQRWYKNGKCGDNIPPGARPAVETEAEGPLCRVRAQPAGGSAAQPQPVLMPYNGMTPLARYSNILRKAGKAEILI